MRRLRILIDRKLQTVQPVSLQSLITLCLTVFCPYHCLCKIYAKGQGLADPFFCTKGTRERCTLGAISAGTVYVLNVATIS